MQLADKVRKMKNNLKIKTFKEVTEDKGDMVETHVVEKESGCPVAGFVKKDGKIVEQFANTDAQSTGDFEKAAAKVGAKKEDLVFTSATMAAASANVNEDESKPKDFESDSPLGEKAKLLQKAQLGPTEDINDIKNLNDHEIDEYLEVLLNEQLQRRKFESVLHKSDVIDLSKADEPEQKPRTSARHYKILTDDLASPKMIKGTKFDKYVSAILHLAPYTLAGHGNVCPGASKGCAEACLNTAGRGGMIKPEASTNVIQDARIARTKQLFKNPSQFWSNLLSDVVRLKKYAGQEKKQPVLRLNGTSDLSWESYRPPELGSKNIFEAFPDVQFYDYTKLAHRVKNNKHQNYHLTFSRSESNENTARQLLKDGHNVAVVFDEIPQEWNGHHVISGDEHDFRFLDPKGGHVVGLKAKGDAKADKSGFVVWTKKTPKERTGLSKFKRILDSHKNKEDLEKDLKVIEGGKKQESNKPKMDTRTRDQKIRDALARQGEAGSPYATPATNTGVSSWKNQPPTKTKFEHAFQRQNQGVVQKPTKPQQPQQPGTERKLKLVKCAAILKKAMEGMDYHKLVEQRIAEIKQKFADKKEPTTDQQVGTIKQKYANAPQKPLERLRKMRSLLAGQLNKNVAPPPPPPVDSGFVTAQEPTQIVGPNARALPPVLTKSDVLKKQTPWNTMATSVQQAFGATTPPPATPTPSPAPASNTNMGAGFTSALQGFQAKMGKGEKAGDEGRGYDTPTDRKFTSCKDCKKPIQWRDVGHYSSSPMDAPLAAGSCGCKGREWKYHPDYSLKKGEVVDLKTKKVIVDKDKEDDKEPKADPEEVQNRRLTMFQVMNLAKKIDRMKKAKPTSEQYSEGVLPPAYGTINNLHPSEAMDFAKKHSAVAMKYASAGNAASAKYHHDQASQYYSHVLKKNEPLTKPPVSEAQRGAMYAAASGKSNIGIPKKVGKEFVAKDPGGKLPEKIQKAEDAPVCKKCGSTEIREVSPGNKKSAMCARCGRMVILDQKRKVAGTVGERQERRKSGAVLNEEFKQAQKMEKAEAIKGGLGDGAKDKDFNKKQLDQGIKVEFEHTDNPKIAKEIAKDHLTEFPKDYYTRLKEMENKAELNKAAPAIGRMKEMLQRWKKGGKLRKGEVIDFAAKKKEKEKPALFTSAVPQKFQQPKVGTDDFATRLPRIRQSLEKINRLMGELKKLQSNPKSGGPQTKPAKIAKPAKAVKPDLKLMKEDLVPILAD